LRNVDGMKLPWRGASQCSAGECWHVNGVYSGLELLAII
jgi:hypothetical protein